jgi:purine-cytosine permease-like protein
MGNGKQGYTMRKVALNLNGISIAYVIGLVNAIMAVVNAFGLNMNETQRVAVVALGNAALVLAIHLAHRIGEASASGQVQEVAKAKMDTATESAVGN